MTRQIDDYPTWYLQVYGTSQFPKNEKDYWKRVRDYVIERDVLRCQACRKRGGRKELTVHHITPRANGGTDELDNLITLHYACHDYVEVMGYRTKAEIVNATKGLRKSELTNAVYRNDENIPAIEHPCDENAEPPVDTDERITCPCGIIHLRSKAKIGTKITTVDCICGRSATYRAGLWFWKARYTKPEPKPEPKSKSRSAGRQRKPSPPRQEPLECPFCNKTGLYPVKQKVLTCECGNQAMRVEEDTIGIVWFGFVKLRRDVFRRG